MGSAQSSLSSFIFPELSESDLKTFVNSLKTDKLDLTYERTLGKGRVSWSMLVRNNSNSLLLMRLYAKRTNFKSSSVSKRRSSSSMSCAIDPLSATKLSFIHELYYEKCAHFDFVMKPLLINDCDEFLVIVRPFARYNLTDRIITDSLLEQDKYWLAQQLIEAFLKLHSLRAFHGDFGSGKVFLTSDYKILIGDFAPIKPFCLQNKSQTAIEFYQIWFDEGLDGEIDEIGRGCYLAPERIKYNSAESWEAADMFSLGCVLAEIFGSRAFFQFKDILSLSKAQDSEEYDNIINLCIERTGIQADCFIPIIRRLCSRDPANRTLEKSDIITIESRIDQKLLSMKSLISCYRFNDDFYEKKRIISKFTSFYNEDIFDNLLLHCLKEKNPILAGLLVKFILERTDKPEMVLKVLRENFEESLIVKNVLKQFSTFHQLVETEKIDLNQVLESAIQSKIERDKRMIILNKLLQIYRKREEFSFEFESKIFFEYFRLKADEESLKYLFKTCHQFYNEKYKTQDQKFVKTRIAFQLDLEKNNVPIESTSRQGQEGSFKDAACISSKTYPKLKQRKLNESTKWEEHLIGVLQSPDKTFIIGYSETTLHFWDLRRLVRSVDGEPLLSVNPRADSIMTSVIFGMNPDSLFISFKDGIIGFYEVVGPAKDFNIKESFGPFESGNSKLLMTKTHRNASVLLVIGTERIYGISPKDGEVLFEFTQKISHVIDIIEGTLMIIDLSGRFSLIDIFYESGQVLCKWKLEMSSTTDYFEIEATSAKLSDSKINLFIKLGLNESMKVILLFQLDPLCEIAPCSFRHWILNNPDINDKSLPFIKFKRVTDAIENIEMVQIRASRKTLIGLDEEVVDCSSGKLRLIDFKNFSSLNSTSILGPTSYKPTLKLRNKQSQIPEIVEKPIVLDVSRGLNSNYNTNTNNNDIIEKLETIDGKNLLIFSIINNEIMIYY